MQSLRNNTIYFSSPADFNDPLRLQVYSDRSNRRNRNFQEMLVCGTRMILFVVSMLLTIANFHLENTAHTENYKVFCLSEINNNTLLWSHYADSHHGICLIFKAEVNNGFLWLGLQGDSFNYNHNNSIIVSKYKKAASTEQG